MAAVTITCLCGRQFTLDTALAGTSIPCPTCNRPITVPDDDAPNLEVVAAPLASTIGTSRPAVTPPSAPKPQKRSPVWGVLFATGLLVVAAVMGIPAGIQRYHKDRVEKLHKEHVTLPQQKQERQAELERQVRNERLQLNVTGPAALQAGAANNYLIETKSLAGDHVATQVILRLTDKAGNEVAKEERAAESGRLNYTVPLPAALKPDDELTLEITAARDGAEAVTVSEKLPLERTGFVTHLTTDKPLYQPGEVVAFRSLTLERFRLQPSEEDLQLAYVVTDPSGQVIFRTEGSALVRDPQGGGRLLQGPDGRALRGVGFGEFTVPRNAPGGEYTLTVSERRGRFAPQSRKFLVNRYQAPRLHKELEFTRRSYGPGDEVLAAGRVRRIEGGKPLAGQPVSATVLLDGQRIAEDVLKDLKTDAEGNVAVRFKLPAKIDTGEASLSLQFTDGGNTETIVRPIPIVVRRLRVDFYPEGGDLIAGVPNRVYFAARTPLGKPAELRGRILDAKEQVVAEIRTTGDETTPELNHGLGVFTFTPAGSQSYRLQIDSPAGIPYKVELPAVKPAGVALNVDGGVSSAEPVKLTLHNNGPVRKLLAAVYCRGRLVGSESLEMPAMGSKSTAIALSGAVGGVFRVTIFEQRDKLVPVAERLVYRHSPKYLNVAVQPDKSHYVPGEKVRLAVSAKDENGKPAGAIALVQVVDRAALSLADDKTLRSMPTHFLLAGEVKNAEELENADILLSDHPLAAMTVDLLLGTQGWRRFAEQDPAKFREQHGSEAERLLAAAGQSPLLVTNHREAEAAAQPLLNEARRKADAEYGPRLAELNQLLSAARTSERNWEGYTETGIKVGIAGLVLIVLAALAMITINSLIAAERKAPGTLNTAFGVGGICALVMVFLLFIVALFAGLGTSSKATFQNVGSAVGARDRSMPTSEAPARMVDGRMPPMAEPLPSPIAPGGMESRMRGEAKQLDPDQLTHQPQASKPMADTGANRLDESPASPGESSGIEKTPPGESARRRYDRVMREQRRPAKDRPTPPAERSFKELDRGQRSLVDPNAAEPFVIRQYAHENIPGRATRSDFTETVFWHPVLVLSGGETFVNFSLSDAITSYQALAYVHTPDGRLGAAKIDLAAKLPFSLDAKLPIEVTRTDELHIPLAVSNDTDLKREVKLTVDARGLTRLDGEAETSLMLDPEKRGRAVFKYKPSVNSGEARVIVAGQSDFFRDRVERTINVVPEGFPVIGAQSGTLSRSLSAKLVLPQHVTPGSLKVRAEVYPSVLADLLTGIEGMLREPHGCFEQTSSSSYPNLLILDYLQNTGQSRPEIARRALELIERGYNRLLTFECRRPDGTRQGYEWFGGFTPPHEALTAYGLMQFHDLARVYDRVDPAMVERTRQFLLSRRDGQGNFQRKVDYHQFGRVSQPVFNAYIVWALAESEADADLNREVQLLVEQSATQTDPYFLALVASSLLKRNDQANGTKLLDKLVTLQSTDGSMPGRESIVGSYGNDLHIEATALTVLAWLKADQPMTYREPLQKAVKWLTAQRGGYGGFGSTQATILTLKALSQVAREARKLTPGSIVLALNGNRILQQEFAASAQDTLVFELAERDLAKLQPGENEIRLEISNDSPLPAKISWTYQSLQPPSADDCPLKLTTKLDKTQVKEGETVRLTATVENTRKEATSMAVAIIGLPAGLTLPEDLKQLQELTKPRTPLAGSETPSHATVSYFEVRGRELVLYWRGLEAGQKVEVPVDLVARTPGQYRGPASRAYLYYGADAKHWVAPLTAAIAAR